MTHYSVLPIFSSILVVDERAVLFPREEGRGNKLESVAPDLFPLKSTPVLSVPPLPIPVVVPRPSIVLLVCRLPSARRQKVRRRRHEHPRTIPTLLLSPTNQLRTAASPVSENPPLPPRPNTALEFSSLPRRYFLWSRRSSSVAHRTRFRSRFFNDPAV